jgi:head-tail adaptor
MPAAAGQLRDRLEFYKKVETSEDALGNTERVWELQFTIAGRVVQRIGGETVLQARLSGQNVASITVRMTPQTKLVSSDWKAVDVRSYDTWNIRSAVPDERKRFVEILAERGVVT